MRWTIQYAKFCFFFLLRSGLVRIPLATTVKKTAVARRQRSQSFPFTFAYKFRSVAKNELSSTNVNLSENLQDHKEKAIRTKIRMTVLKSYLMTKA